MNNCVHECHLEGKHYNYCPLCGQFLVPRTDVGNNVYVCFVVDESGSMGSIRRQAIEMFNAQIGEIQNDRAFENWISFMKFGSQYGARGYDWVYKNRLARTTGKITTRGYTPSGMTPMYDAVGAAITEMVRFDTPVDSNRFLMIIISDGLENYSREYTADDISKMTDDCQRRGNWTFVYLGANQNVDVVRDLIGLPMGNVQQWQSTPEGTAAMSRGLTGGLSSTYAAYTAGETSSEAFFELVGEGDDMTVEPVTTDGSSSKS